MATRLKNIVGMKKQDFDQLVREKEVGLRSARLIPLINPGKEEALTSIFLSSLTLVDEFRRDILNVVGMPKGGQLYVYTEAVFPDQKVLFPDQKDCRIDGLILLVAAGKIKSAAILEMKNGTACLEKDQVGRYLKIAKTFGIPKMITVSNEFVSEPTQSPLGAKKLPKGVELYHLSWQFIRTLARIRLFENDTNIEDIDQVRIMEEVVAYLENEKSGVGTRGFSQMKAGWKEIAEKVASQASLRKTDPALLETVESWLQEERDMALKLSCELGALVHSGVRKFKGNIQARIENDLNSFLKTPVLTSNLIVQSAVSDVSIRANFRTRTIEMSVNIIPPLDKTVKGQFGWMRKQVENKQLKKKMLDVHSGPSILDNLYVELYVKHARKPHRFPYRELEDEAVRCKGMEIKTVSFVYLETLGRKFAAPKKFVEIIETMLPRFYGDIVQHLKNWTKPAPKIPQKKAESDAPEIADPGQNLSVKTAESSMAGTINQ